MVFGAVEREELELPAAPPLDETAQLSDTTFLPPANLSPEARLTLLDGVVAHANDEARDALAAENGEDLIGAPFVNFVAPECRHALGQRMQTACFQKSPSGLFTARLIAADGQDRYVAGLLLPHAKNGTAVVEFLFRAYDAPRQAERAVHQERRLQETILEQVSETVFITDDRGRFTYVCPNVAINFGFAFDEVARMESVEELLGPGLFDPAELERCGELQNLEWEAADKDGRRHTLLINVRRVAIGRGTRLYVCRDITERKAAERERDVLFHQSPSPMFVAGFDGYSTRVNPACSRLLGYSREELLARPFLEFAHPDDRTAAAQEVARLALGEARTAFEIRCLAKDGSERWIMWSAAPLPEGDRFLAVGQDTTERRRMEQALCDHQAQLQQAQKMEAVGQLAGGVAHDFNNLLTVILACAETARDQRLDAAARDELLSEIEAAGQRAAALTRKLLAFSRRQVLEPEVLDVNLLVFDSLRLLRRVIDENIELTTALDPDLGLTRVDRTQIEQVILNLAVNARDAMPSGGRLTLETRNVEVRPGEPVGAHGAEPPPGSYVMLAVHDTGCGMSPEVRRRIFEPFFTTKAPGEGTGMGLAMAFGIVKQSQGYLAVESQPGRGSVFRIYLPRVAGNVVCQAPSGPQSAIPPGPERILLVEDEEAVRRLTQRMLEASGYEVLSAATPDEAVALAEDRPEGIDLLVTDVVMPGASGPRLAEMIRQRIPRLKVLYISGYAESALARQGVLAGEVLLLEKPFTREQLTTLVRQALSCA